MAKRRSNRPPRRSNRPPRRRNPDATLDEYTTRREIERKKAYTKYGERALEPGGDPAWDVIDYTINELVGLVRYSEMLQNRATRFIELMKTNKVKLTHRRAFEDLLGFARTLEGVAGTQAMDLIAIRQALLKLHVKLGKPEQR